ncbi:MAG: CBS domain-containing protein, partial [Armatimonadetes bacterium]|nr:CBS domain-containing protein [Armatimonadota bacterium]
RENIVFISGIGCSSRFPYYMDTYGIHSIHGRAPTLATGLKLARPELKVFVVTGDGDGLSIGGNHLLHALRRNVDITIVLFNNRIYGLTKGQFSPTTPSGQKTKSSPMGSISQPLNPLSVALAAEATFVARSIDVEVKHLQTILQAAAEHAGASFVEVYQNCNIFNDGAWRHATDPQTKKDHVLQLEHGKPMLFGNNRDKGIVLEELHPKVVALGDEYSQDDLLVHDAHRSDASLAYLLSRMEHPALPVPIGIFRQVKLPTYERAMSGQVETAIQERGKGDLKTLYFSSDIWTVSEDGAEKAPMRNGAASKNGGFSQAVFGEMMAGWSNSLSPMQQDLATHSIQVLNPQKPLACQEEDTLAQVVERMREESSACALVCDAEGKLVGIFTDRDILRVALLVKDLREVRVRQCMYPHISALNEDLPVARALHLMSVQGLRHLPVVNERNEPTGVVTYQDIVDYLKRDSA